MPRLKKQPVSNPGRRSRKATPAESPVAELERLICEQRDDQEQDRTGLRTTVLGDCLRGIGVRLVD